MSASDPVFVGFVGKLLAAYPDYAVLRAYLQDATGQRQLAYECLVAELEHAAYAIAEPQVAAAKLHWWSEELERMEHGAASHPLTQGLSADEHAVRHASDLPARLLEGAIAQIEPPSPGDLAGQLAIMERFYLPLAELDPAPFPRDPRVLAAVARARALARLLRELSLPSGASREGRLAVPLNLLARHQLVRDDLVDERRAAPAVREQLAALDEAGAAIRPALADASLPLRLRVRLDARLIARARRNASPLPLLRAARGRLSPLAFWIAWREARRAPRTHASPA